MKKWQIENLEISEILFRVFLFPSFRFCPIAKIENSDLKISEKISEFSEISEFSTWPQFWLHIEISQSIRLAKKMAGCYEMGLR